MIDFEALLISFSLLASPSVLLAIPIGLLYSIVVGAIPGFNVIIAIVTLLPLTYALDSLTAIVLLSSAYGGAVYGGSITAISLRIPGTPGAAMTAIEGYELTKKGKANEAFGYATISSVCGGIISYLIIMFIMFPASRFALMFASPELFAIVIFAISIIGVLKGGSMAKGLAAGIFGLLLGVVGLSPYGVSRADFGMIELMDGIPEIPALIGLLAFTQIMFLLEKDFIVEKTINFKPSIIKMFLSGVNVLRKNKVTLLRSSIIGMVIGLIPAAGASIASFISYNEEGKRSPELIGKGSLSAIVAAESANNASEAGSMATMLALGVPGSGAIAVIMGALIMHGIRPGPRMFTPSLELPFGGMTFVYAIILTQLIAALMILPLGLFYSKWFSQIVNFPTKYLAIAIALFCVVGAIAIRNSLLDAWIMLIFGVLGYIMSKYEYPPIATVLGLILAPIADAELIRSNMMYHGRLWLIATRPIVIIFFALTIFGFLYPFLKKRLTSSKS